MQLKWHVLPYFKMAVKHILTKYYPEHVLNSILCAKLVFVNLLLLYSDFSSGRLPNPYETLAAYYQQEPKRKLE